LVCTTFTLRATEQLINRMNLKSNIISSNRTGFLLSLTTPCSPCKVLLKDNYKQFKVRLGMEWYMPEENMLVLISARTACQS
jgi:hypothetical protein